MTIKVFQQQNNKNKKDQKKKQTIGYVALKKLGNDKIKEKKKAKLINQSI